MKTIFFIIFLLFSLSNSFSAEETISLKSKPSFQKIADKNHYLVDSLIIKNVSPEDLQIIDSALKEYHNSDVLYKKLQTLVVIIEQSWDINVWPKYNDFIINEAENSKSNSLDTILEAILGEAYQNKGFYYTDIVPNKDSTYKYYELSASCFHKINYRIEEATALSSLGLVYFNNAEISKAVELYNEALKIYEDEEDFEGLAYVYNYLSGLHVLYNNNEKAIEYSDLSYANAEKINLLDMLVNSLSQKANIYRSEKKYHQSLLLNLQSLEISKDIEYKFYYASQLKSVSIDYLALEKLDTAFFYAKKAQIVSETNNITTIESASLNILAKISLYNNDLANGISYANKSLLITKRIEGLKGINETLYKIYDKIGDDKKTLFYFKKFNKYKDEIYNSTKEKNALKQSIQYQFDKQKEINELKHFQEVEIEKQKTKRNWYINIAAIFSLFLITLFLIFIFNKLKIIRKQKLELDSAYEKLDESKKYELALSNLKTIRSQMNPHFIFNSLNSIQDLVLQQETDKSYDYIALFANLVRSSLSYSEQEFISIDKELEFLKVYLKLEKLRFGDELSYEINYDGSLDIKTPSLLIQPFIENALLHGLLHKKGDKKISITFELKDQMVCTIIDNGIGRKKAQEIKNRQFASHSSFSTKAINKRMDILSNQYNMDANFVYEDIIESNEVYGTKVIIKMPFHLF